MGSLNPTLQSNVRFSEASSQPASPLGAVAELAGLFTQKPPEAKGPTAAEVKFERELNLRQGLAEGLNTAAEMRRQGDEKGALRFERQTKSRFALAGGDLADPDIAAMVFNQTGQDMGDLGFSPEEQTFQELRNSPEFSKHFLAAKNRSPDASQQELESMALVDLQGSIVNEQRIAQTKVNWNTREGQQSRVEKITTWRESNLGALSAIGDTGRKIGRQDIQATILDFENLKAEVLGSRPVGLSAEEWAPIEKLMAQTTSQLKTVETLTSNTELGAEAVGGFVEALDFLHQEGDITLVERNIAVATLTTKEGSTLMTTGAVPIDRLKGIFSAAIGVTTEDLQASIDVGNGDSTDPAETSLTPFSTTELNQASEGDPKINLQKANDLIFLSSRAPITNNPESTERWVALTQAGLANTYAMAADHEGWLTGKGYRDLFNSKFFRGLEDVGALDKRVYTSLYNKTIEAIDVNLAAVRANISSRAGEGLVQYDRRTNSLSFDIEAFRVDPRFPPHVKDKFLERLDFYGGDIQRFFKTEASDISYQMLGTLQDEGILDRIDAVRQLEGIKKRLNNLPLSQELLSGGDGVTDAGGSQEADALAPSATGARPIILDTLDKVEGGGNYDTLFGHSQREGGQFAGVRVSQMTIGDLLAFSGDRTEGSYGKWVQGRNPKGALATPMGRYQIVGTTLAQTAKEMGLHSNIRFTEEVQDAMFHHLAKKSLAGKTTDAAKRKAMRGTWDGFNHVSDAELDAAIADFEGRPVPAYTELQGSVGVGETSPRPVARPENLVTTQNQAPDTSIRPVARPESPSEALSGELEEPQATEVPKRGEEAPKRSPEVAREILETVAAEQKAFLQRIFGTEELLLKAIQDGTITLEDLKGV